MFELDYVPLKDYDFGFSSPIPLAWNPTVYCLVAAFSAVPMWMTMELTFQIYATFKTYTGLYFWSLLVCTWCITLRQIGRICIYFVPGCNQVFSLTFAMLGWVGTVTGFSVVLYSRLHLVTRNRRIRRGVLCMIIADVFILHLPTMVAQIGVVTKIHRNWVSWYPTMEKVQIVGFTIQETIISGIYIYMARRMVKKAYNDDTKQCIRLLILVQVTCILLDVPFIVLAYTEIFLLKATLTSFAYAIKLKLEFIVLNQLIGIVKHGIAPRGIHHADEEQVPQPPTRRPSAAVLVSSKRRFSLAPFRIRTSVAPSIAPSLPSPAARSTSASLSERIVNESGSEPTPHVDSSGRNTLVDSERTTNSVDDEILPSREEDESFADTEKRYLGQYGKRTTL
jgi:hypothetical protein